MNFVQTNVSMYCLFHLVYKLAFWNTGDTLIAWCWQTVACVDHKCQGDRICKTIVTKRECLHWCAMWKVHAYSKLNWWYFVAPKLVNHSHIVCIVDLFSIVHCLILTDDLSPADYIDFWSRWWFQQEEMFVLCNQ